MELGKAILIGLLNDLKGKKTKDIIYYLKFLLLTPLNLPQGETFGLHLKKLY